MKHIVSLSQEKPTYVEYDGASDRFITQGGFGLNDSEADLIEDMAVDLYDDNRWVYFLSPRDFLDERMAFTALNYDILSLGMNLSPGIKKIMKYYINVECVPKLFLNYTKHRLRDSRTTFVLRTIHIARSFRNQLFQKNRE